MVGLGIAMCNVWYAIMTINRFTRSTPASNASGNTRVLLLCGMQKASSCLQEHIFIPTALSGFEMRADDLSWS